MDAFLAGLKEYLLAPAITVAYGAFIFRLWINHGFQKKLDKFRVELEKEKEEYLTRTSLLFEKKIEVVSSIFSNIASVHNKVTSLTNLVKFTSSSPEERINRRNDEFSEVLTAFIDLDSYFRANRLFLPDKTCEVISTLIAKWDNVIKLHFSEMLEKDFRDDPTIEAIIEFHEALETNGDVAAESDAVDDIWLATHNIASKEIPPILAILERDFRDLVVTRLN